MISAFQKISLEQDLEVWLEECLSNGKTLAKLFLQSHNLEAGRITMLLCRGIDNEAAGDF